MFRNHQAVNMIVVSLFVLLFIQVAVYAEEEDYTIPPNFDVDAVLNNQRLLKNYFECLMGRGPCTPEGERLRKVIPEILREGCENKCKEKDKPTAKKAIRFIIDNKPEWWKELQHKFDPTGEYKTKYQNILEEENVKLPV